MVIGYMVKSHKWSILSWSNVGSFINKIDQIYGQWLITVNSVWTKPWTVCPYIRYAV